MRGIEVTLVYMITTRWSDADEFIGIGILKYMLTVVLLLATV